MYSWMNSDNIYAPKVNLWAVFMYFCATIHALFEYKGLHVTYTVENVGGCIGQDPATEVTHLVKSTSSPFQCGGLP